MEDPHLQYSCTDLASSAKCETAAYPLIRIFKKGNKQPSLPNQSCAQQPQHQQHSPSSVFLSVCQNLFEADPKPCFTASPNSYYTQVFCSTFVESHKLNKKRFLVSLTAHFTIIFYHLVWKLLLKISRTLPDTLTTAQTHCSFGCARPFSHPIQLTTT